jgi:hypothetical protein
LRCCFVVVVVAPMLEAGKAELLLVAAFRLVPIDIFVPTTTDDRWGQARRFFLLGSHRATKRFLPGGATDDKKCFW